LLPDIEPAVERIARAINAHERILVFGDYDVDGTSGTALLVRTLKQLGGAVGFYNPHRAREGYGLSEAGIRHARDGGYSLIVAVDCGTTDFEETAFARNQGIDVVVADHHEVREQLPEAVAIVNPKRPDSRYPFTELCGCGVAFKLAQAVCQRLGAAPELVHDHLDLVALATIADVVPLSGENRILARIGLAQLRRTRKCGLQALLRVTNLTDRDLGSYEIGYILGPRLNASGRMGEARHAVQLLLTDDATEALELARQLDAANDLRKTTEDATFQQALNVVEQQGLHRRNVLVLADERWHEGVIGIVASRLVDRFYRPAILIALDADRGKGSGRSIPGFHLHDALKACANDLLGFGGHKYAAGLTILSAQLAGFAEHVNDYASGCLTPELLQRRLVIDAWATLAEIDRPLLEGLARFEPFGPDNPRPVFAALGLEVVGYPRVVGDGHLRLTVRENKTTVMPAIAFGRASDLLWLEPGKANHLDVAFRFNEHTFAGRSRLQLQIEDLRKHPDSEIAPQGRKAE
jgi:single-stranded-DNA-specific exonuclease